MEIRQLISELKDTYTQKNNAYGNNAHITFCWFGTTAYALRLTDKASRYETLMKNKDLPCADESVQDTLKDFITYSIMASGDLYTDIHDEYNDKNISSTFGMMYDLMNLSEFEIRDTVEKFERTMKASTIPLNNLVYKVYSRSRWYNSEPWECFFELAQYGIYLYFEYMKNKGE